MKTNFKLLVFLGVATLTLFFAACKKSTPPTVKIHDAVSTSYTSANVTGEVTDEGSSSVTERGFIYGKQGESKQDTMFCGSGTGEFPTRLTGLKPNTTYNCFAFARNDGGMGTSGKVTFTTRDHDLPIVTTSEVENVGSTTASCGGNVMDDGGTDVTERGVCWGTNHNPTISGSHALEGEGLGDFTCNITNLSANTTYYVRAYANNSKGVGYGEEKCFTTLNLPAVSTGSVTNITTTSATGSGNVTNDGGSTVTERGLCWSTNHVPTIGGQHVTAGNGTGNFTAAIANLNSNTTYYMRAYATNGIGTCYGDEVEFTTQSISLPGVTTANVTNVTNNTATGGGNVISTGGANVTERGICWSTSHNPTISGSHSNNGTGTGSYTVNMTGLTPNTTYYVKAYAINNQGTAYGEEVNFKTSPTSTFTVSVSANPTNGGTVIGDGTYEQGQSCTVRAAAATGYNFQKWMEDGSQVSTNANYTFTVTGNRSLVAYFTEQPQAPTGAINGKFTVNSSGSKVYFSQGNLQYKASTAIWRFAPNQYDIIGPGNSNISASYNGWIDLFGWGTSGWNCGNTYYRPWDSNSSYPELYGPYGEHNLTSSYVNSDWGCYNAISNGGNVVRQWRTLDSEEWAYICYSRNTISNVLFAKAQVNHINGIILLPDDWSTSYYTLLSFNEPEVSFTSNVIDSNTWRNILQIHGAVFLPCAGYRIGYAVNDYGTWGMYWSSTSTGAWDDVVTCAYIATFFDGNMGMGHSIVHERHYGLSVRLVYPAE